MNVPVGDTSSGEISGQPAWQAGRVGVLQEPQDVSPWPDLASVASCTTPRTVALSDFGGGPERGPVAIAMIGSSPS